MVANDLDKVLKQSPYQTLRLMLFCFAILLAIFACWGGLTELVVRWDKQEEYGHGYFIPLLSLWFLWERRGALFASIDTGSYWGCVCVLIATIFLAAGEVTAFFLAIQLAFILMLMGIVLAYGGKSLLKISFVPLFFLVFSIPLPYFLEAVLTARLQLLSSEMGVWVLRLLGTSVYLEGNLIDLGQYRLQVVEACSGLRYLYPLMGIAFLMAYMYQAQFWKRWVLFLSSIPITVVMNSLRIAMVGILVDYWGGGMADGFLHYFEGWVVFMLCLAILLAEIWIFEQFSAQRPLSQAIDIPKIPVPSPALQARQKNKSIWMVLMILLLACGIVLELNGRVELKPSHKSFDMFPLTLSDWQGTQGALSKIEVDGLQLTDYWLADYRNKQGATVNYYMAYYASQRKGISPHSPQVCMPGGGWLITSLKRVPIIDHHGKEFMVNRVVIQKNQQKQLVYYWFEQRGRRIASEYWMKYYLLKDATLMNRTDGALVRLVTPIDDDETNADKRMVSFIHATLPILNDYIPE